MEESDIQEISSEVSRFLMNHILLPIVSILIVLLLFMQAQFATAVGYAVIGTVIGNLICYLVPFIKFMLGGE